MKHQGITMKNPPHPGGFLRGEILEGRELTMGKAAEALGVGRQALSDLLNGRAALTPTMAIRIEKAFGFKMETLIRMQHAYDIAQARQREGEIDVKFYVANAAP